MGNSDVVIRVEGLGKKYSLRHEKSESYTSLKDVVARQAKVACRLLNPFTLAGQLRKVQREAAQAREASEEEFWALKDVSFEIRRGERVGIIGRNGAGKSTLLKILSRITEPTTGRVEIRGRVASLLEVGTGFHPELTGRENIYLNGAILGMTRREIRLKFDEIVDFAEVEKFLDTPVKRYSSGMYVRLAFAVAAHLEPDILVVDEVLAVGDVRFQKKCLEQLGEKKQTDKTILFVSHNSRALIKLCPKAILMSKGCVSRIGSTKDLLSFYESEDIVNQSADLLERSDRSGSGDAKIAAISAHGSGPNNTIITGGGLIIRLKVQSLKSINNIQFAITIKTFDQIPVFCLMSTDSSWAIECLSSSVYVELRVKELSLYPGNYILETWIGDQNGFRVDLITNALTIKVEQDMESSISRNLNQSNGLVYVYSEWTAEVA